MSSEEAYALAGAYANNETGTKAGAAYALGIYENDWVVYKKITAYDAAANDFFGSSVALYGEYGIVGAPGKADENNSDAGAAYIFD